MIKNKKIKIHIKNNHGQPGTFPCDLEGEKNFTITHEHFEKALENEPKIKEQIEIFIDWDENNFNSSMLDSEILLTYDFPITNLKKIAPNLKWIHCTAAGVEHLFPFSWTFDGLKITNSSGVHAKKAGEFGLMSVLMLQNHLPKITLVSNACLLIQWNGFNLLTDPWIEGPAIFGSWEHYPPSDIGILTSARATDLELVAGKRTRDRDASCCARSKDSIVAPGVKRAKIWV